MNKKFNFLENIKYTQGDIFKSKMQTIVNTVNCKGVMGAGLAKKFREKYPEMYEDYVKQCKSGELRIGKPTLWKGDKWILNFPTKEDWRMPSKLEWIEEGLKYFVTQYKKWGITSIAFPALGCDLGGLSWIEVRYIMEKYLSQIDIPVEIYIPKMTPMEKILDYIIRDLDIKNNENIKKINIIRSFYPDSDGWTDWKKTDTLKINIVCKDNSIESLINNIEERIKKDVNLKVSVYLYKEETSSPLLRIYNIVIKLI